MSYYLTKANPNKWMLLHFLKDLDKGAPSWWSDVCKDAKPGDTLFMGLSGEKEAGIYAKATIISDPKYNTPDQDYAIPPGSAKERLGADIDTDSFKNLIERPIMEKILEDVPELRPIARWLHAQGARRHLTDEQGEAIDRLIEASNTA